MAVVTSRPTTLCIHAWTHLFVSADGRTGPCCNLLDWGDIRQGGETVFCGSAAAGLRRAMCSGRMERLPPSCRECHTRRRLAGTNDFLQQFGLSAAEEVPLRDHYGAWKNREALRQAWEEQTFPPAGSLPLQLTIQLGERCNLRCAMCFQEHAWRADLPPSVYPQLYAMLDRVQVLQLTGGEPLVYPVFWQLAEEFARPARPGSRLSLLTNGLLFQRERLEKLARLPRFSVAWSIDAACEKTYEYLRRPARWSQMRARLDEWRSFREEQGRTDWFLTLSFVVMKCNIGELSDAIRLAKQVGAGFGCGPITGVSWPPVSCRTYFNENFFELAQPGWERADIVAALEPALAAMDECWPGGAEGQKQSIRALQEYALHVPRIEFADGERDALSALSDEELSAALAERQARHPRAMAAEPARPSFWRRLGRRLGRRS